MMTNYPHLFRYHFATTQKLFDLAGNLNAADLTVNPGYGQGSVQDTLQHLLIVSNSWHTALVTGKQAVMLDRDAMGTLPAIGALMQQEAANWDTLVTGFSEADLATKRSLINYRGDTIQIHLWHALQQVLMHGMQHHSELARVLTEKGHSPGNIDVMFYPVV